MTQLKNILLLSFLFISIQLMAVNRTWTGAIDNTFNTVGNWTGGGVLASGDNFTVNLSSSTTIILNANITINDLTFVGNSSNGSGAVLSKLDVLSHTLTINGNFSCNAVRYTNSSQRDEVQIDAGSGAFIFNGTATFHTTGDGDVFIEADASSQGSMTFHSTLTLGDWVYTSPGIEPDFIYDAVGTQTVNYNSNNFVVPASMIFGNVNSPTVSLTGTGATTSFSIYDGALITNNGSIADIGSFDCNSFFGASMTLNDDTELRIGGDSDFPSSYTTTTIGPASKVTYNGASAQNVTALTYGHIEFAGSNTKTSEGSFSILGDWTNNGTFAHGNDIHTFSGTADQIIGGTNLTTFYQITEDKSTGTLFLDRNTEASNRITLATGAFDLNGHNMHISNSATDAITRTDGYFISERSDMTSTLSWFVDNTAGVHVFPFGTVGGAYVPFTYERVASSQGTVTVATYPTLADDNVPYAPTITNMNGFNLVDNSASAVNRFWDIDVNGTMNANLTYTYTDAEAPGNGEISLRAQQWDSGSSTWLLPSVNIASQTSNSTTNTVTANGVTQSTSNWTLALNATLLPIELTSFTGTCNQETTQLEWATNREINNDFFTVEKSFDAVNFEAIGTVQAAGNSQGLKQYSFKDNTPYHQVYYRLKQTDFNNNHSYSDIIYVASCEDNNVLFVPYQRGDDVILSIRSDKEGEYSIHIIDLIGQSIFRKTTNIIAGNNSIVLTPSLTSGYYLVQLTSKEGESYNRKMRYAKD